MTESRLPIPFRYGPARNDGSRAREIVFPHVSRRLWEAHREKVLKVWLRRRDGTRPPAWWAYDAPGLREQIGGRGIRVPDDPRHANGIPTGWRWIDPSDPPSFEAQCVFLERHGLLFPGEARKFPRGPPSPEPLPRQFWPDLFSTASNCEEFLHDHERK